MFEINYSFSETEFSEAIEADESALRYCFFLGDVVFNNDGKSIVMDWNWIPILDFALCILKISDGLDQTIEGEEIFEFTESGEQLFFQKHNNNIQIVASFSEIVLGINFETFKRSIVKFYKDVVFELLKRDQDLKKNAIFWEYIIEAEGR